MARILALDTTAEFGSIALYDGASEQVIEVGLHSPEGFGHILFDRITSMLDGAGWGIHDIDCFASASGPGSFTGVRIGLTAAKGLAEATRAPVAAISNLRALAWFGSADRRAVIIDARRGEIYGAVYDATLAPVQPERVGPFQNWLQRVPEGAEFISVNIGVWVSAIEASRGANSAILAAPSSLAGAIARIAHREYQGGNALDPAAIDANYVRRSDAELFWKEM